MQATQPIATTYPRSVVVELTDKHQEQEFLRVHIDLNQHNPNWIRPLDKDVAEVFDPTKNKYFRHGEATRWLLYNDKGNPQGRIAAFVNTSYKN